MRNLDTQICEDKDSNQFQAAAVAVEIHFKELCTKLFNHLVGLSVTRTDWLFNKSLPQLWAIPLQSWPQLEQSPQLVFCFPLFVPLDFFPFFAIPLTHWKPGNNNKKL